MLKSFSLDICDVAVSIADRVLAFMYLYSNKYDSGLTPKQMSAIFETVGFGVPNITALRRIFIKDKRIVQVQKGVWRLKKDKEPGVAALLNIGYRQKKGTLLSSDVYVSANRITELSKVRGAYDFTRLIRFLEEINDNFQHENYLSVIILIRAILDHIPPIFGCLNFAQLTGSHGTKSIKEVFMKLDTSTRKIADMYLHTQIRKKESLPNRVQVNFSNELDVLLAEVLRVS